MRTREADALRYLALVVDQEVRVDLQLSIARLRGSMQLTWMGNERSSTSYQTNGTVPISKLIAHCAYAKSPTHIQTSPKWRLSDALPPPL
jgi:hypothetical protein